MTGPPRNDRDVITGSAIEKHLKLLHARIDRVHGELRATKSAMRSPTHPVYDPAPPPDAVDTQIAFQSAPVPWVPPSKHPMYFDKVDGLWHPIPTGYAWVYVTYPGDARGLATADSPDFENGCTPQAPPEVQPRFRFAPDNRLDIEGAWDGPDAVASWHLPDPWIPDYTKHIVLSDNVGNIKVVQVQGVDDSDPGAVIPLTPGTVGSTGPRGTQGNNGATGATGPAGATGTAGSPGGATGATGAAGSPGGATGATGPAGASGSPGGATGATGATGPEGNMADSWLGAWASGTGYVEGDIVSRSGSVYICIVPTSLGDDPATSPLVWEIFTSGGVGATGATGAGATGATGPAGSNGGAGATGATGPPGSGATGATGAGGSAGGVGATGATGPAGSSGGAGAVGATGATGGAGATGATGGVGATGATGPSDSTAWTTITKSADESVSSSTAYQDDDDLHFVTTAGAYYEIELDIIYASPVGGSTPNLRFILAEDGTIRGTSLYIGRGTASTAIATAVFNTTSSQGVAQTLTSDNILKVIATFIGGGGTCAFKWCQNTSNANAVTVRALSVMRYRRVA